MTRERPDRGSRPPTPRPLADSLDRLLGSMNSPPADVLQSIFGRWPEMVGEEVARHTRPAALDGSKLVVACDTSAWASELRWLESQLLERIAEVTGSSRITSLSVRVERPS